MTFWEEHYRSEGAARAAEAHKPKATDRRTAKHLAALDRLPQAPEPKACTACGVNPADLLGTCLPCDVADGYLDLDPRETP